MYTITIQPNSVHKFRDFGHHRILPSDYGETRLSSWQWLLGQLVIWAGLHFVYDSRQYNLNKLVEYPENKIHPVQMIRVISRGYLTEPKIGKKMLKNEKAKKSWWEEMKYLSSLLTNSWHRSFGLFSAFSSLFSLHSLFASHFNSLESCPPSWII